ncbi:hypothetical protein [Mixta mediterraneensis]|uniref:hypothetical protein n=1 Tax=Mixta mediterraneensis TaxID=2758443 RepID=UPI00187363F9|nr:hypothetical protein [Mixta mediterraneensis]MBE5254061.1 hypothetical protein [Mixta mediterraneensis]
MSEAESLYFLASVWLTCITLMMLAPLSEFGEAGAVGAIMAPLVSALSYFDLLPAELTEFMRVPETWLTPVVSAGMFVITLILLWLRSRFIKDC